MHQPEDLFRSRRSVRLQDYDYRQAGVYFVTLCTYLNANIFGRIRNGDMVLSDLGKVASEEWQHIAQARKNVELDLHVVMPNHLHGVIIIDNAQDRDSFQCLPTAQMNQSGTLRAGSLGAIIGQFKLAVARQAKSRQLHPYKKIWQRNYHEHIVRSEESLCDIRQYILENPARRAEDSLYVE